MGVKGKVPDLGVLESCAASGVRHVFGGNPDIGDLRGGKTARDIKTRRCRREFDARNCNGAVVPKEDIAGELGRSGKDRGNHLWQQARQLGVKIEAEPAACTFAIEGGGALRPGVGAGVEGELGVEGVEHAASGDAELDGRAARNIGERRENAARGLVEVDAEVEALAFGHEIEPDIERCRPVEPLRIEKQLKPFRGWP